MPLVNVLVKITKLKLEKMRELLEKYKNGTLSTTSEQDIFMHELLQIRAQRMQNHVINTDEVVIEKKPFLRIVGIKKYFAAAACLLLACFSIWNLSADLKGADNQLRADITSLSEDLIESSATAARGNYASTKDTQSEADKLYENKDYEGVINVLENKNAMSDTEELLLAGAYDHQKVPNYSKALDCYSKITAVADYKQNLALIIAMHHVQLGNKTEAREKLNLIINDKNEGQEHIDKAKKLLEGLNKRQ